ncbi:hypothetical protein [Streptomyces sp. bgisy154]|uniref:hypothetical protein n=1 Tax=Streptomyces sp. bgisy154 TaxID=3413794 RepID=UPI003D74809C
MSVAAGGNDGFERVQSLPAGASTGVRSPAAGFPESENEIAVALRELEEHGYLARQPEADRR